MPLSEDEKQELVVQAATDAVSAFMGAIETLGKGWRVDVRKVHDEALRMILDGEYVEPEDDGSYFT